MLTVLEAFGPTRKDTKVMQERLPGITVKPDVLPELFLERVRDLVPLQRDWQVCRFDEKFAGRDYFLLELAYQGSDSNVQANILSHFVHDPKLDEDSVRIEMKILISPAESIRWTYDSYVHEVYLLKPLLRSYNQAYQARVRLNIQSRHKTEPRLPPTLRRHFDFFVNTANKYGLHQSDWQCFYKFIILAHKIDSRLSEEDVKYLLVKAGFYPAGSQNMAEVYRHGRAILHGGYDSQTVESIRRALAEHREEIDKSLGEYRGNVD